MGALSKGCGTCKRRKVKCDETHPKCVRCRNAGVECTGFAPRLKFVDEGSRVRRSMRVSRQPSSREGISLTLAPSLGSSLSLTAFKDDIFISYLLCRFFEGDGPYLAHTTTTTSRCGLPADWIPELAGEKPRYKSWDALATIVFGQAHQSYDVIRLAFRLYGQALSELRSELSSSENRSTDSTLASITALYLYEVFVTGTAKCWMWHANGLAWLLERRGPWQQKFYAGKAIFLEHRIMLIAKSIVSRQSTFLHDPIWKTVPWEDDPTSKSAIDYLVDIGADIAECLARSKTHDIGKSSQEIDELEKQVATSLEDLNIWWHQRGAEHAQTAIEVTSLQAISTPLFPTLLEYDTVWAAFTICTYNAIRILLLQLWQMLQLYPSSAEKNPNQDVVLDIPNRTALLGITSDSRGLACEILRSLTFCYRKSRRFVSTFTFLFIQEVAYGCFDQDSEEAGWITQHGWAKLVDLADSEHDNLLKSLLPSGQIYIK